MYKAYFDASIDWAKNQVVVGYIIANNHGDVIHSESKNIGRNIEKLDNNYAEWFALNQLLKMLRRLQINEVEIYGDNRSIIDIANGFFRKQRNKELHRIIWKYAAKFNYITFNWISRKQNKEADKLTRNKTAVVNQLKKISKHKINTYAIRPNDFDFNFRYKETKRKIVMR